MPSPHLRLLVADRCNLDCAYCHFQASKAGRDLLAPGLARAAMRSFAAAAMARQHRGACLSLYGGEPLLNVPALEAVLDEALVQREAGFAYDLVLNTNGTLLPRTGLVERLAALDVDVHVSLDGPDEASNHRRVNRAGKSSWPAVEAGLRLALGAGCRVQINAVLDDTQRPGTLRALIDFSAALGCRRIFMALPDGAVDSDGARERAHLLLSARGYAQLRGVDFFGPWRVGLRGDRPQLEWPPLNVIVKPDGRAFVPYVPHQVFADVAAALAADAQAPLQADWQAASAGCADCALGSACQGYLKMMVRYHTGTTGGARAECSTALQVARLAGESAELQTMRTSVDLRLKALPGAEFEVSNPLVASSALVVSADVIRLLDLLTRGGNLAGLDWVVEADGLRQTCSTLLARGLLSRSGCDTDALLLAHVAPPPARCVDGPLRMGAATVHDLERLQGLAPGLHRAVRQLPLRLRTGGFSPCVVGAAGRDEFARLIGGASESSAWMAATVLHTVLVLDLDACQALVGQAGAARREAFERGLVHELAHLALRQGGIRVPVWFEEGLCQHLAEPPLALQRLCEAATQLDTFIRFALDCRAHAAANGSHVHNLLRLSTQPVDRNPAYQLAQDLAAWSVRREGLDPLIDRLQAAGLGALADPFEGCGLGLEQALAAWAADLRGRVAAQPVFPQPLRLVARGNQALIYHRFAGGFATLRAGDAAALAEVAGRNLELGDGALLRDMLGPGHPLYARWLSGVYPEKAGRHLRLTLADGCNLGCSYCYEGSRPKKNMSIEVADRAVAAWRDRLRPGDLEHSSVRFFGGEPLLNWAVMRHVLDTAATGLDAQPRWIVNTNGTLLRDEHVQVFVSKGSRLGVALSMDGLRQTHDRQRVFRSGRGSFDAVDRAARALAQAQVPLTLTAVVGDHNLEGLLDLASYAVALRDRYRAPVSLALEPILSAGGDESSGRHLLTVYEQVMEHCRAHALPLGGKLFYASAALLDEQGASGHFCAVTRSELSVGPEGELLVCQAIPGSVYGRLDTIGGPADMPMPASMQQRSGDRVDGCGGCEVEGLCGGGCTAQSVRATGDAYGNPGPLFCNLVRGLFRRSLEGLLDDASAARPSAAAPSRPAALSDG